MASPLPEDPFEILGVNKDVEISTLRTVYRKLLLKHHPDRIHDPVLKPKAREDFQRIHEAYKLLSDPVQRARYDDMVKLAELRKAAMAHGTKACSAKQEVDEEQWAIPPSRNPHDDSRPYKCSRCDSSFRRPEHLERHFRRHSGQKHYACKFPGCISLFHRSDLLTRHSRIHEQPEALLETNDLNDPTNSPSWDFARQNIADPVQTTQPDPVRRRSLDRPGLYTVNTPGGNTRRRSGSVYSRRSSRNSSLGGGRRFETDYQQPAFARGRAGSGSDYDIYGPTSPGLPPEPKPRRNSFSQARFRNRPSSDSDKGIRSGSKLQRFARTEWPDLARSAQTGPYKCERINLSTGKACNIFFSRPYDQTCHDDAVHDSRKTKVRCHICPEEKTFSRHDALTRHMRVVHPDVDWVGRYSRHPQQLMVTAPKDQAKFDETLNALNPTETAKVESAVDGKSGKASLYTSLSEQPHNCGAGDELPTGMDRNSDEHQFFSQSKMSTAPVASEDYPGRHDLRYVGDTMTQPKEGTRDTADETKATTGTAQYNVERVCYICHQIIRIRRRRDWQKHVLKDLQPYQCLEKQCSNADIPFSSVKDLRLHYTSSHSDSRLLGRDSVLECFFCQQGLDCLIPSARFRHLARHMEENAFAVVPRPYENWDFYSASSVGADAASSGTKKARKVSRIPLPKKKAVYKLDSSLYHIPQAPRKIEGSNYVRYGD